MHAHRHERRSANDQTAAQIDPFCASFERPQDVSAAVHIGGSGALITTRIGNCA
jgi:hypothetical protein